VNGPSRAWMRDAACRDLPLTLFFGPDGETAAAREAREAEARTVCAGCPVRDECLTYRLSYPRQRDAAIWAGLDEDERTAARRALVRAERREAA